MNIHEETLKIARNLIEKDPSLTDWVISKFPELKESEDEMIRKELIVYCQVNMGHTWHNIKQEDYIEWLEKQGEPTDINPSEFDLRLNKLLKQFETLSKEELTNSLSFYLNVVQNDGTYREEKQGKQKPADNAEPKFEIEEGKWYVCTQTYTLKGKIVVIKGQTYKSNQDGAIEGEDGHLFVDKIDGKALNYFKPWTIQDAEDGDVLCCENGWTCIFKALDSHTNTFSSYCFMDNTKWFCETGSECHTLKEEFVKAYNGKIYPATKEQRDTLIKAMADAGYTFDFEKKELKKNENKLSLFEEELFSAFSNGWQQYLNDKQGLDITEWVKEHSALLLKAAKQELKKIENEIEIPFDAKDSELQEATYYIPKGFYAEIDDDKVVIKKGEKPAVWSEEDEKMLDIIQNDINYAQKNFLDSKLIPYDRKVDWFKSLKDRVQPKVKWSEEDEEYLNFVIAIMKTLQVKCTENEIKQHSNSQAAPYYTKVINWLKFLKDKYIWKPSVEQLEALESATENCAYSEYQDCLKELIKQLKQL